MINRFSFFSITLDEESNHPIKRRLASRRSFLSRAAYCASRLGTESRHGARGLRHERRGQRHDRGPPQDGCRRGAASSGARPQLLVGARIGRGTAPLRRGQRQRWPQEGRARTRLAARRGAPRQQDPQEEALQVPGVVAHRGACPRDPPLVAAFSETTSHRETQNSGFKPPGRSETPNVFVERADAEHACGRADAARLRVSADQASSRATFPPHAASPDPASAPTRRVPDSPPPPFPRARLGPPS